MAHYYESIRFHYIFCEKNVNIFSDVAAFSLNSHVNNQNCRYYACVRQTKRLHFKLIPAFSVLFLNPADPDIPNKEIWFQQDMEPLNFQLLFNNFLMLLFLGNGLNEEAWLTGHQGQLHRIFSQIIIMTQDRVNGWKKGLSFLGENNISPSEMPWSKWTTDWTWIAIEKK